MSNDLCDINDEEFIVAWVQSFTIDEVIHYLLLKPVYKTELRGRISMRASEYRRNGIPLKKFSKGKRAYPGGTQGLIRLHRWLVDERTQRTDTRNKCSICGKVGHYAPKCPLKPKSVRFPNGGEVTK